MLSLEATLSSTRESAQQKFIDNNFILNSGSPPNITQTLINETIKESLAIRKRRACFTLKFKKFNFASFCEKSKAKNNESIVERVENNDEIESLASLSSAYNSENDNSSTAENTDDSSGDEEQQLHLKRLRFDSADSPNFSEADVEVEEQQSGEEKKILKKDSSLENCYFNPPSIEQLSSVFILEDSLTGKCFELIGSGCNCKAIDLSTQEIWHCQSLKQNEFNKLMEIVSRMKNISHCYTEEGFAERSNLLLPIDRLQTLRSNKYPGLTYILLPTHHDSLHKLIEEECGEEVVSSFPYLRRPACLSERIVKQILKQITVLIEFCHRIGLFFRDFRFCKFVFTDPEKTKLRLNNVLDLYLSPNVDCDLIDSREFVPAYVSPEVLDKRNQVYGGRAADIWAFGVMMFTLLNGRYPFFEQSHSPIELLRRIRSHCFSFCMRSQISEPARWLIHSLLKPCPSERPSAAQILQAHWFRNTSTIGLNSIWSSYSLHSCKHIEKLQQSNNCKLRDCPFLYSTRVVPDETETHKCRRKLTAHLLNPLRSFFQEQSGSLSHSELNTLRIQPRSTIDGPIHRTLINRPTPPSFVPISQQGSPFISVKIDRQKISADDQVVPESSY